MVEVMQKFCLTTIVEQINQLTHLTHFQKQILKKVKNIIEKIEYDSDASFSTVDFDVPS